MTSKKAYFIDLDNTIYFTKPNADALMGPLYRLLDTLDLGITNGDFGKAKEEMLHTPFQRVASKYNFKPAAVEKAITYLKEREVDVPIAVHEDYQFLKKLKGLKFIVTAGFTKAQLSKIKMLGVTADFDGIYVVDLTVKNQTKKEVFLEIIEKYQLQFKEILIIGDDANTEIKIGQELGIATFLFDPTGKYGKIETTYHSKTFIDIAKI